MEAGDYWDISQKTILNHLQETEHAQNSEKTECFIHALARTDRNIAKMQLNSIFIPSTNCSFPGIISQTASSRDASWHWMAQNVGANFTGRGGYSFEKHESHIKRSPLYPTSRLPTPLTVRPKVYTLVTLSWVRFCYRRSPFYFLAQARMRVLDSRVIGPKNRGRVSWLCHPIVSEPKAVSVTCESVLQHGQVPEVPIGTVHYIAERRMHTCQPMYSAVTISRHFWPEFLIAASRPNVFRAVPKLIRGGAGTFLSCGGRVFCWQRVRGVGGWG